MKSYKRRTLQQHNTCKSWQFPHSYHLWCWRDVSKINDLFLDVKYIQVQNVVITSLHQSVKSRAVVLFCTLKERQHNSVIWQFDKVADFSTASLVMESLVEGCSGKLEDKCFLGGSNSGNIQSEYDRRLQRFGKDVERHIAKLCSIMKWCFHIVDCLDFKCFSKVLTFSF